MKGLSTGEKTALCSGYDPSHRGELARSWSSYHSVSEKHKQDRSVRVAECGAVTPKPGVP